MIFQILSMFVFGVSNCFWENPVRQMPALNLILIRSFLTTCCFALFALLFELKFFYIPLANVVSYSGLNFLDVIITIGLCFVNYWGLFFFLKSIQHTDARISIVMGTAGTLIFVLIGILFYGEKPSAISYLYMFIFTMGWWFIENLRKDALKFKWSKGVVYAILCMLFWRTAAFFPMVIKNVGTLYFSLILEIVVCLTTFAILFFKGSLPTLKKLKRQFQTHSYHISMLVICGFFGVLFFNIAISSTQLYTFALIGMLQPLTSVVLGSFMFKTRLTVYQGVGILILLAGMALQMA